MEGRSLIEDAEEDTVALRILFPLLLAGGGNSGNLNGRKFSFYHISPRTKEEDVMNCRKQPGVGNIDQPHTLTHKCIEMLRIICRMRDT
jgi:hypothetical protein